MKELQAISYNLWKNEGDYPQRLDTISQLLAENPVDLYFFQEVFSTEDDQYNTLRHLFPDHESFSVYHFPCRQKTRFINGLPMTSYSGLSIISRFDILDQGFFKLPTVADDPERYAIWCSIELDNQPFLLINTHLTHLKNKSTLRQRQFECILRQIDQWPNHHVLLGGDMNQNPDFLPWQKKLQCLYNGITPNTLNTLQKGCLDHFYLSASGQSNIRFKGYSLHQGPMHDKHTASDHKAVIARIGINSSFL